MIGTGAAKVFKHDQFSPNLSIAAEEISDTPLTVQPGFCQFEAFGQQFQPSIDDYPLKIVGVDLILAAPPNQPAESSTHAMIEIWFGNLDEAAPVGDSPDFSVSTEELIDPDDGTLGVPLQGNAATSVDFDWDNPLHHPPLLEAGAFRVVVRFIEEPTELSQEWGTPQCAVNPELGQNGCQSVGVITDEQSTPEVNLLNVFVPYGVCPGPSQTWHFAGFLGVEGDFVLRVRTEVAVH